ncbi:MAG: hypothetical protein FWD48_06220 [Oscillospiraceae bacterium]|nr:hypothetical protein [Oscillospiraceae bacterium]
MSQHDTRRNDKSVLFQALKAQYNAQTKKDFNEFISWTKAKMEPEDVKLVLQEFEEWKKDN